MMTTLKGLWRKQSGDDIAEYALLVAMIALAVSWLSSPSEHPTEN
jgi:Flp pilus assembly pilin Flp